jgi:hypothetical protein
MKEHEAGVSIVWEAKRLKTLEDENTRLTEIRRPAGQCDLEGPFGKC